VVVVAALALAGCADDGASPEEADPTTTTAEPLTADEAAAVLAFQPVLSVLAPDHCDGDLPTDADGQCYELGPVAVDARAVDSATATLDQAGNWQVNPVFRPGDPGIETFNAVAARCFAADPTCPGGALAVVVDGKVISAPRVQQASFEPDRIQITGTFTEAEAEELAEAFAP
jgi:preprotein translocase subunit SecD